MTWYKSVFLLLMLSIGCSDDSALERNHLDLTEIELINALQFKCFVDSEEQINDYMKIEERADDPSNPVQSECQELLAIIDQLDSSSAHCIRILNNAQKELIQNYGSNMGKTILSENTKFLSEFETIHANFNRSTEFRKLNSVSLKHGTIHQLKQAFKSYRNTHFKLLSHAAAVVTDAKQVSRNLQDRVHQYKKREKMTCIYREKSAIIFSTDHILITLPNFDLPFNQPFLLKHPLVRCIAIYFYFRMKS